MAIQTITYEDANGKPAELSYIDRGSAYQLSAKREQFAQLMANGARGVEAYVQVFGGSFETDEDKKTIREMAGHLLCDTTVVLRIQELKKPVIRKLRRRIEYGLQKALEQCEIAFDLAYQQGDAKSLLKAVEMQARLAKLLSEEINVNHRHGLLDDAGTQTLLELKKEIEVRQAKRKKLLETRTVEGRIVSETPQTPSLTVGVDGSTEAVGSTVGQNF